MIESKVSKLLKAKLFSNSLNEREIFNLLDKNIMIDDLHNVFKNLLESKTSIRNIGIDLPIWFGDINSSNKTIIVALDPKRNKQENRLISIGSVFSLHKKEYQKNNRDNYWSFTSYLSEKSFVYLTDIYKIYYEAKSENGSYLLSNKDKSFTNKECYEINKSILEEEILEIVKPNKIITLGLDAANAVKRIKKIKTNEIQFQENEIEYLFLPHISRTVTQNIKTIGNLYKGLGILTQKKEIENIGNNIIKHSELKKIIVHP